MAVKMNLMGAIKAMKKGEKIELPWARLDKDGFKMDYVRSAAARIASDNNHRYSVSATREAKFITVTRIS